MSVSSAVLLLSVLLGCTSLKDRDPHTGDTFVPFEPFDTDQPYGEGVLAKCEASLRPAAGHIVDPTPLYGVGVCQTSHDDGFRYDTYEVQVTEGDCVHVFVDNVDEAGTGNSDVAAWVVDAAGDGYGWESTRDYPQLMDDDVPCTHEVHNPEFSCPAASLVPTATGPLQIHVWTWPRYDVASTTFVCDTTYPYALHVRVGDQDVEVLYVDISEEAREPSGSGEAVPKLERE